MFPCPVCLHRYTRLAYLKRHVCRGTPAQVCPRCGGPVVAAGAAALAVHQRTQGCARWAQEGYDKDREQRRRHADDRRGGSACGDRGLPAHERVVAARCVAPAPPQPAATPGVSDMSGGRAAGGRVHQPDPAWDGCQLPVARDERVTGRSIPSGMCDEIVRRQDASSK
ncbi:hypothetical protein PHYSODRAFT_292862 [Phytophthora sojae]|uniref:Uncharacterized protein n=1 Tax=Phytophthora sojae (strain P6497) TaxID=1094619 RepID=G4YGK2_PHYSP|nr:hypothetical protein PHYSODRAFT_292862 [Phytophthora sojae]EGZ26537.1 hypothetical protein PHYSODRAFT_292862 [Phytophthora sojae]|eukprot:XP_009513812.1 hypothetical protein PHYSODRAFT_292862 [Phytophthora sojae]